MKRYSERWRVAGRELTTCLYTLRLKLRTSTRCSRRAFHAIEFVRRCLKKRFQIVSLNLFGDAKFSINSVVTLAMRQ